MYAREVRQSWSLLVLFPAFCILVIAMVALRGEQFADPGSAIGSFALLAALALAGGLIARQWPAPGGIVIIAGSVAMLFAVYSALSLVIPWLLPEDREWFLLRFDRLFLGYTWEGWWLGLRAAWWSDLLQLVYTSFYGFPLVMGVVLARRKDWLGLYQGIDRIILGFLVSYCGYLLVPTRSPYGFVEYAAAIPTHGLQAYLHEEIIQMSWTKRDCFPSGHTMMSSYVAWLSWQRARSVFWILGPWAMLTLVATLYLRYHYLIDVIVGLAACVAYAWCARWIWGPYAVPGGRARGELV